MDVAEDVDVVAVAVDVDVDVEVVAVDVVVADAVEGVADAYADEQPSAAAAVQPGDDGDEQEGGDGGGGNLGRRAGGRRRVVCGRPTGGARAGEYACHRSSSATAPKTPAQFAAASSHPNTRPSLSGEFLL